jgi:hypothetical protein
MIVISFIPLFQHSGLLGNYKLNFWEEMKWLSKCSDANIICE